MFCVSSFLFSLFVYMNCVKIFGNDQINWVAIWEIFFAVHLLSLGIKVGKPFINLLLYAT